MPRHCSAGGCKSRDNRETRKAGITFHKLPKGASRRNLWIKNSHRKGLWNPQTDFVYFCSKHFTPESFELTGYSGIRRLREDAFPTVFDASLAPKRKGPGRPRKRDAIHLRQNPPNSAQDPVLKNEEEAEKADCENVLNLAPAKEGESSVAPVAAAEADVGTSASLNEAASEADDPSRPGGCPSPSVPPQTTPPLECPASPSRYMRRLPPPPGFYLPKEHSYAQLCPLLWRRRCERAVDCLERALRQLSAARRRENRLRNALSRLREKRPRPGPKEQGQRAGRDLWPAGGRVRGAAFRAAGDGSLSAQQEAGGCDPDTEEAGGGEPTDGEETGDYCFNCNRAGDGWFSADACSASWPRNKNKRFIVRNGAASSPVDGTRLPLHLKPPGSHQDMFLENKGKNLGGLHEHRFSSPELLGNTENVQLVVLEGPPGVGLKSSPLQITFKRTATQSLPQTQAQVGLQQLILDEGSLQNPQVHHLQPVLSDLGATGGQSKGAHVYKEPCQQVFFVQESTEGQLLLVPAPTQDRLKGADRTDDGAENMQTVLEPEMTFHPDLGPITEDEQNQGLVPSNGNVLSTVVTEDMRKTLKEHLEGFQLQLRTEYIT